MVVWLWSCGSPTPAEAPSDAALPSVVGDTPEAWPITAFRRWQPAWTATLPGDVVDVAVDPRGLVAWLVVRSGAATTVWRWQGDLAPEETGREAVALTTDPFDGSLVVVVRAGDGWSLQRWAVDHAGALGDATPVWTPPGALGDPVVPPLWFANRPRVFVDVAGADGRRIVALRPDGTGRYELTTADGAVGALTDPAFVRPPSLERGWFPPRPLAAPDATPLTFDPRSGALWWRSGDGAVHLREYRFAPPGGGASEPTSWGADRATGVSATALAASPNGGSLVAWSPAGTRLLTPGGAPGATVPVGFTAPPAFTPDGRYLVGAVGATVGVTPVPDAFAAVWRPSLRDDEPAFFASGVTVAPLPERAGGTLSGGYVHLLPDVPRLVTVDLALALLRAGFEAVRVEAGRATAPALRTFAERLRDRARAAREDRLAAVADVALELLDGRAESVDARAATAASGGPSVHHSRVDWTVFAGLGDAADDDDARAARAFRYLQLLEPTAAEATVLSSAPELQAAWTAVVAPGAALGSGTRSPPLVGRVPRPRWVRPDCVPPGPARLFPEPWGLDDEAFARLTAPSPLPDRCGVAGRTLPTGLDWLAALGSPWARDWARDDEGRHPDLAAARDALTREFGRPPADPGAVPAFWRALQLLATDRRVPEGVDGDRWHARLAETALAGWATSRAPWVPGEAVPVPERPAVRPVGFEALSTEPARPVLDPVPEVWDQLGEAFGALAQVASTPEVAGVLQGAADRSHRFAALARRQRAAQALDAAEYAEIADVASAFDAPYRALAAAAGRAEGPARRTSAVVAAGTDPDGSPRVLNVGVGEPRTLHLLVADRGRLLPATGFVSSYVERPSVAPVDLGAAGVDPSPPPWSAAAR